MLFYQRSDMPIFTSKSQLIPLDTAKPVLLENNVFLREVYTFNYTYLQIVGKMCRHCRNVPELIKLAVPIATQVSDVLNFALFNLISHHFKCFSHGSQLSDVLLRVRTQKCVSHP